MRLIFGERIFFVGKGKGKKVFGEGIFVEEKKKRDGKDRISLEKGGWGANFTGPGLLNGPFSANLPSSIRPSGDLSYHKIKDVFNYA